MTTKKDRIKKLRELIVLKSTLGDTACRLGFKDLTSEYLETIAEAEKEIGSIEGRNLV